MTQTTLGDDVLHQEIEHVTDNVPARIQQPTFRSVSDAMEMRIGTPYPVLDHGFVRLIDYMGVQEDILEAARNSYGRGTKSRSEDVGLMRYLMRHRHTTPLEMCEIKLQVKMPIFVARQWVRHRMASINEVSARYSILDNEFYIPTEEALAAQSTSNKQGRGDVLTPEQARTVQALLRQDAETAYAKYQVLLNDPEDPGYAAARAFFENDTGLATDLIDDESYPGLARELARMNLSLNFYTQWYWKTDAKNLLDFLSLRAHPHAQMEIRVYAELICQWVAQWMPIVWEAFVDYRLEAVTFSGPAMRALRHLLDDHTDQDLRVALGAVLQKRELDEVMASLR